MYGNNGGFRRGGGFNNDFGPRTMTKIKCAECGKEDEVPFKPREGSKVFCRDCFAKQKGMSPRPTESKEKASKTEKESEKDTESEEALEEDEEETEEEEI